MSVQRPTVCAVMVTYHPGAEVRTNVAAIKAQVDRIIVVDNESSPASRELLGLCAGDDVELIFNEQNRGVAAALNQGVERALVGDCVWIATFDQDSLVPPGYVAGLLAALERTTGVERVAVLAPLYRDRHLGFLFSPGGPIGEAGGADVPVPVTATSGNLVSAEVLRKLGGFCEAYFIDCVDFEFCLRCRRAGWQVLEVRSVVLDHAAGRWQQRTWLWKKPRFNDYGQTRRYYQARNRIFLYRTYLAFDRRWIATDAWGYLCDLIKLVLFCRDRLPKLGAVLQGWLHGLDGRAGPWHR